MVIFRNIRHQILLALLLVSQEVYSQPVKYYSSDRELSNSMVTSIVQDHENFIWIATEDGLNRFDGLKFVTYRNKRDDSSSLTSNFVRTLYLDKRNKLWVGCINGLMTYDAHKDKFREIVLYRDTLRLRPHVTSIIESANGEMLVATSGQGIAKIKLGQTTGYTDIELTQKLSSEFLECIFEDYRGRLWIGTENEGINLFEPGSNTLTIYRHLSGVSNSLSSNYITDVCEDDRRNILIGTINGGVNKFLENEKAFSVIPASNGIDNNLPIRSIFSDKKFNLWIGTDGLGIWRLNSEKGILEPKQIALSRFDVNKSKIHTVTEDHEGNLWLGVFQKGVVLVLGKPNRFNTITYQQTGQKDLGSGCITAIGEQKNGNTWIGTDTDGLYTYSSTSGQINKLIIGKKPAQTYSKSITSICVDDQDHLWVGTSLEGFFKYQPATDRTEHFKHNQLNDNSLSNDKVQCITKDKKGNLWIGTSGGGLNKFNPKTRQFTRYMQNPYQPERSICNNWVNTVYCDSDDFVWIGTYNRISVLNPATGTFRILSTSNNLLPNNIVYYITEDSEKNIWIGTNEGLVRYNKKENSSSFYTTKDGLCNNVICAILEDRKKQLWISTHFGISCFSLNESTFENYYVHDGLQGNEFRRNSTLRTQKGELFFGGINGITWFVPDQIIRDRNIPEVYLTDLILFNRAVQIDEKIDNRIILSKPIDKVDTIELAWHHKNFSIEFSTIGYSNPERIFYQYRLIGFDPNWNTTDVVNRRATYTNLEPGKYIFEIRAADKEAFSKTRQVVIMISKPWWAAWWFKMIYLFFALLLFYFVFLFIRGRIKYRQELLQHEQQEKINEAKLQFFTNISHEIRTPLSLISGPLESLILENKETRLEKKYMLLYKNTQRLVRLVNQLLDVRKIDSGQLSVNYQTIDLIKFIEEIMQAFDYIANSKKISYTYHHDFSELLVRIDPDNFDKVIYNVLSNAFKFTPENGTIEVFVTTDYCPGKDGIIQNHVRISISDTGHGIESEDLDKIFDRFYQAENRHTINSGTGIGLHLSRTLIEIQNGVIYAENRKDQTGSIFHVLIPHSQIKASGEKTNNHHYILNDTVSNFLTRKVSPHQMAVSPSPALSTKESKIRKKPKHLVLVAEDDSDMLEYLIDELSDHYNLILSTNGREALEKVYQKMPDVVVTDIMMPVMDGIALCRKLKSNPTTTHLPILLITAKSRDEDRAEGLDMGADAYLVKPFSAELLRKNINNLLCNRERIKIKYSPGGNISAANSIFSSADKKLMDKILLVIEEKIADPKLNTEELSHLVGMSRVHLFRKVKKITGQPPSEFIRKIRLQKAAQLIDGNAGFMKEIAFLTGFSSVSHFSRCFHDFYGIKPSDYTGRNQPASTSK